MKIMHSGIDGSCFNLYINGIIGDLKMHANDVQNQKITDFLKANGWEYDAGADELDDYRHFYKRDSVSIDVGENEIVFFDDTGDYAHIPMNVYAAIGFIYANLLLVPIIHDGI